VVGIELPREERLPPGPLRDLVVALHELYRGAGRPGLRRIAKAIVGGDFPDTVSHESVSDMLNGKAVPRWSKLDCVVRQLATWNAPRLDPEQTAARFLPLWEAATGGAPAPAAQPALSTADTASLPAANRDAAVLRASHSLSRQRAEALRAAVENVRQASTDSALNPQPPSEGRTDDEWAQSRHALIAGRSRWREPTSDQQTAQVRHLRENQSSHPAISARSSRSDSPPSMRVGICVACNPLPAIQPTSTALRHSFLSFLSRQPMAGLVEDFTVTSDNTKWEKWGGHGRSNHEAVLTSADQQAAPVAWARLLLPEPRMSVGLRDSHSALFLLDIERRPWDVDGPLASPIPFLDWHTSFRKALECPSALAGFLAQDLGLDIPGKDPTVPEGLEEFHIGPRDLVASVGMWLTAPQAMTDLVDTSGYQHLPGSPASPQFAAFAITYSEGSEAADMAIDWMRQMCDYTLHLDDYDSSLSALGTNADPDHRHAREGLTGIHPFSLR